MAEEIDYKRALELEIQARLQAENLLEQRSRELLQSNASLNSTIQELQNKNLAMVQQEKMASIGLLAAGIAHEINNPIGFVKSNLEVLKGYFAAIQQALDAYNAFALQVQVSKPSAELSAAISRLRKLIDQLDLSYITEDSINSIRESLEGAVRVQDIVRDLKDFSRNDNDERVLFDLNECIEGAIKLVWNEIKLKCTIIRHYGEIPALYCCASQLTQVFINIIMNAVQAMTNGGTIEIRTAVGKNSIVTEFVDDGPGIEEANLNKLFDPFFTTKAVGMGTGLGLYVSHGIIQKHRGSIRAENVPGKGAKLIVTLPVDMRGKRGR